MKGQDAGKGWMKGIERRNAAAAAFALLFALSLGVNAAQSAEKQALQTQLTMERQRDMTDVTAAMADIEVNLQKLLLASGASQSVTLLGETALLAQHVETGLSRLPLSAQASGSAMKFAGQMGEYVMTLAAQVSGGGALSADDEQQIEGLLSACRGLNAHLLSVSEKLYTEPMQASDLYAQQAQGWPDEALSFESSMAYPSLIYDGPFSDGRTEGQPKALTGERITREQARLAAARYAGTTADRVADAADSGGRFEAFGFVADTPDRRISVQVTGQGGRLLWMMPEEAAFESRISPEDCLRAAKVYLADNGFGEMERCFVQQYDGMVVANFAAVQDGVILYPDQVKVQISMETGAVVGAECSMYLANHERRLHLSPKLTDEQAKQMISGRLDVRGARLCVIPKDSGELLCWEFDGTFSGERYLVYIDAAEGNAEEILRVMQTQDGETAI